MTREADLREAMVATWTAEIKSKVTSAYIEESIVLLERGEPDDDALAAWQKQLHDAPAEAKKLWIKRQRAIPAAVRRAVLAAPCAYCGDEATAVDHIIPIVQGGTRDRDNLAPACSSCNFDKLDFTPDEWRQYRLELGLPWPPLTLAGRFAAAAAELSTKDSGG